jgi:hypothetical protein
VTHQVHASGRHGGGEHVQRPAQAGIESREDGGDGEHGRRVTRGKRVDVEHGVRPRPAHQMLEAVFHESGDHERHRAQPGRLVQRGAPLDASHESDAGANDEQRDAAADGIQRAHHAIEHRVLPRRHAGGHATVERDGADDHQKDDADDGKGSGEERAAAPRPRRHHPQSTPLRASAVSATPPTPRPGASGP